MFPPVELAFFGNYVNRYRRQLLKKVSQTKLDHTCKETTLNRLVPRSEGPQSFPSGEHGHEQDSLHLHGEDDQRPSRIRCSIICSQGALQLHLARGQDDKARRRKAPDGQHQVRHHRAGWLAAWPRDMGDPFDEYLHAEAFWYSGIRRKCWAHLTEATTELEIGISLRCPVHAIRQVGRRPVRERCVDPTLPV